MKNKLKGIYQSGLCGSYLVEGFVLLMMSMTVQTVASGQSTADFRQSTIDIESVRPLAHALDRVQELLRSPINYEEVPYENDRDFSERSTAGLKSRVVLRGGQISANIEPAGGDPYLAVQTVLAVYTSAQLPGAYDVVKNEGSIDVIPTQVLGANGSMRNVTPVMSRPVAFPYAERSVLDTLQLIVDSVSQVSGVRVLLLSTPFHYSPSPETDKVTLGATGEEARVVIANLVAKLAPMSYRLLYDPGQKTYYLSLISVPASLPNAAASRPSTTRHGAGAANSFFIKDKK